MHRCTFAFSSHYILLKFLNALYFAISLKKKKIKILLLLFVFSKELFLSPVGKYVHEVVESDI